MSEELIKELVQLDKDELLKLAKQIHNLDAITNKSNKDNLLIRYLAFRDYHSITQFYNDNNVTKDSSFASAIQGKSDSIKTLVTLKEILNIPTDLFLDYLGIKEGNE